MYGCHNANKKLYLNVLPRDYYQYYYLYMQNIIMKGPTNSCNNYIRIYAFEGHFELKNIESYYTG